jgi:NADH-quinone oxidoreductase subunit L
MTLDSIADALGLAVIAAPAALSTVLITAMLSRRSLPERVIGVLTSCAVVASLAAALGMLIAMLRIGEHERTVHVLDLVSLGRGHFSIRFSLLFDRLSVPFLVLTLVLTGLIGAFANRYLHRERGHQRFFLFYSIFLFGMVTAAIAGTIETLFVGWELVGLSSVLLIGFFQDRRRPVLNGHWVWSIYRLSDAAFLVGVVALHHTTGQGDFGVLTGNAVWPDTAEALPSGAALTAGLFLLLAVAGKSALLPFSNWLPRAMEGPTPSSAVFYGALSVHLGVFLLLRAAPVLEASVVLRGAIMTIGLATAVYGGAATRVQNDVKSRLAFASIAQVGLITAEIGLGLYYVALVHICGHAVLRSLQLLRAPSILEDYRRLENAAGVFPGDLVKSSRFSLLSDRSVVLYRLLYDRGVLDTLLHRFLIGPFIWTARACDAAERLTLSLLRRRGDRTRVNAGASREEAA